MLKSVFLRRILVLVVTTVLLFSALTSVLYFFISRSIYSNMKAAELEPKAKTISSFVLMYLNGEIPLATFTDMISVGPAAWDAWVFILDGSGKMMVNTELPDSVDPDDSFVEGIASKSALVLQGETVEFTGSVQNSDTGMMIVGVPIIYKENNEEKIVGAVFLAKPLVEVNAGVNSMTGALLVSTFICLLLMIYPTIIAGSRIIKPLKRTRDIALAMANGNFSIRANVKEKGEIGELAASFNLLGERLELTISDLVAEKNRLMRVLNGLAEGIVAVDIHCSVTHANPALWQLIHFHKLGQSYADLPQETERALIIRPSDPQYIRQQLIADESVWNDFRNVILTKTPLTRDLAHNESIIRVMITPIEDESDKTIGAVGLFQDITEAELLEQTRKDYVANISHELRTPLTAMRGLIEPLSDGLVKTEEDKKRYYDIILRETMRLSRLIEDMLELSRLQAGKIAIETKPFYVQDVVEDVVDKYKKTAESKGITLRMTDHFQDVPVAIGNADRIEQVLVILIDNALKFTPSGGNITIESALEKAYTPAKVYISVNDTGVGIEPEKVSQIFERFYKADQARYGTAGSGLGLSIAKEILNTMGQEISVTSEPGRGTSFIFTLSLKK
jgi:signal transduction histidine kinase